MARYEISSPTGEKFEITAPDDATEDQILAYAQKNMPAAAPQSTQNAPQAPSAAPQEPQPLGWGDVPLEALKNAPASAGRVIGGLADTVAHPWEAFKSAVDLGTGGLRAGMKAVAPDFTARRDAAMREDNPESYAQSVRADAMASGAWDMLKNRYGGSEELKKTLATDPVGVAGDLAMLTGVGSAALPGKAGALAGTVSRAVDPLYQAGRGAAKVADAIVPNILGTTTGAGAMPIREAYRAGREGDPNSAAFRQNMRGEVSGQEVVDSARQNLANIRAERQAQYQADSAGWKGANAPVDFAPIDKAYQDMVSSMQHRGKFKVGDPQQAVVARIGEAIDEWRMDPGAHTVNGLDALKQLINDLPYDRVNAPSAGRGITQMRDAISREIKANAPDYAKTMENWGKASDEIDQITKTLSLGDKASVDTALRKLTSLTRNNANTNYGYRLELANRLQDAGVPLMPQVAGQALNSPTPRGLQSAIATGAGGAALVTNPWALPGLLIASPRTVGEAAHAAGRVAGKLPAGQAMTLPAYGAQDTSTLLDLRRELEKRRASR